LGLPLFLGGIMELAEQFFKLFEGNKRAYGVVDLDDSSTGKKMVFIK